MESQTRRRMLRGFIVGAILTLMVGAGAHVVPVRADGGGLGGPPPSSMVALPTPTPTR